MFGGKITTYRRLAEDALEKLSAALPEARRNAGWTKKAALPGGDFAVDGAAALAADLSREYPFLDFAPRSPPRQTLWDGRADDPGRSPVRKPTAGAISAAISPKRK